MSVRDFAVVLKPAAKRDIRAILLYTGEQWGTAQRRVYREVIDRALGALAANPLLGRSRDEVAPGLRSFPAGQHVIYYRIDQASVTVFRILHGKMDAPRHLTRT
jgi:toxin ParE1/3/4